jgi:D-glycero-alpha-D-manno-heptose 1-phosphate guanylyltransferase
MHLPQAVILVGGLGKRVREMTGDRIPKPLLDINGEPFLALQLRWLKSMGVDSVTLASGHLSHVIEAQLGNAFEGVALQYSDEGDQRMGTGGALRLALERGFVAPDQPFLALNGDTWFPVDLQQLIQLHYDHQAHISLALRHVDDLSRYGAVHANDRGRVSVFGEKSAQGAGWINGGVYVIESGFLQQFPLQPFSLEHDVLAKHTQNERIFALQSQADFCDIGTPEDYQRFCQEHKP